MNTQKSARTNISIQLSDGRRLGYSEYGQPGGRPVLFFHAAPGSSRIHADMAKIAIQRGIRLIAVDRPGYGVSDPKPNRTFLSWADDIANLTEILKIDQFSAIGFSGGCPYPLACAFKYPNRLNKVALVAALVPEITDGMPSMVTGLYALAKTAPDELRKTFSAVAPSASALIEVVSSTASNWDKIVLRNESCEFELDYKQALLNGIEGVASDYILFSGSYGFPLAEIKTEVHLWSGTLDQNTPPSMTHLLASQLSNSHTHVLQNEGHYVLHGHWEEILKSVDS